MLLNYQVSLYDQNPFYLDKQLQVYLSLHQKMNLIHHKVYLPLFLIEWVLVGKLETQES
ncbi:MAG: hypothetical protein ETSY2_46865 [Candidatus Entotheonella gemina]|uniref:Uncharacterized protein n=1 Tax=Candidatus Entotheonella gemina TaxID=1429439 RepID=W4LDM0_9BACT|nr:MAG: hypothetical protein ETSY2_46865 [Candidatus Entotheonella gemina]